MEAHGQQQWDKILGTRTIRKNEKRPREPNSKSNLEKVSHTKVPTKKRYAASAKKGKHTKPKTRHSSLSSPEQDPAMFTKDESDPTNNSSDPNEEFDVDISDLPLRKSDRIEQQSQHQDSRQYEDILSDASDNNLPPAKKQYTGTANFQPPEQQHEPQTTQNQVNVITTAATYSELQHQPHPMPHQAPTMPYTDPADYNQPLTPPHLPSLTGDLHPEEQNERERETS